MEAFSFGVRLPDIIPLIMPVNVLFDLIAPIYDRLIQTPDTEKLIKLLNLPAEGWLLDVGGGTGRISSQLIQHVDKLALCDLSFPMLIKAQDKQISHLTQARSHTLPFPDEFFERILVVDALHHFDNQPEVVQDLMRVLKPGGRLLIEEPDIHQYRAKLIAVMEKMLLMKSKFHTPEEIMGFVGINGGSARIETDGFFTAWVVVDK